MIQIVQKFISAHGYYPNKEEFEDYFFSHPDFPSLYAITDTMDFFGIENLAARVTNEQLPELPNEFLTIINSVQQEQFIYVLQHDTQKVSYLDDKHVKHSIPLVDFLQKWEKVVVVIDKNENKTVAKSSQNNGKLLLMFGSLLLLFVYNHINQNANWVVFLYAFFVFFGLVLSVLLLQEGFGINNEITAKICKMGTSNDNGCQSVLSSSFAKLYKNFTLSDACFVFFAALVLLLTLSQTQHFYYISISLLVLPIVIFSVYYQYKIVKKWCMLCLGISTNLVGIALVTLWRTNHLAINQIVKETILFLIVLVFTTLIWNLLKPIVLGYFELKKENREQKRFKRNAVTFSALLNHTPKINPITINLFSTIEIGKNEAQNELLLFLSPSCGYCHIAFKDALTLVEKFPDELKIRVGFNVNLDNENNPYAVIISTIVEQHIQFNNGKELLSKWHLDKIGVDAFKAAYQIPISEETQKTIRAQFNWCNENGFNYAPVRIFNQKLMPKEYAINDLSLFIKEFDEN